MMSENRPSEPYRSSALAAASSSGGGAGGGARLPTPSDGGAGGTCIGGAGGTSVTLPPAATAAASARLVSAPARRPLVKYGSAYARKSWQLPSYFSHTNLVHSRSRSHASQQS